MISTKKSLSIKLCNAILIIKLSAKPCNFTPPPNVESTIRTRDAVPQAEVCVCVPARRVLKLTSKVHFELRARPNDQIHTKHVKTAGLESIHLNTVYVLK